MTTNNAANNKTAASGKVLQGQGVGTASDFSTATYPSIATGTGKILRADGTNWVATTATYPDTAGTSGNVLTSDGTNWISSAASGGGILSASGQLTSAQIKALHATPIQSIAAPGSGNMIYIISIYSSYVYGGSNVFVAAAAQTVSLYYGTTTTAGVFASNAELVGTTSTVINGPAGVSFTASSVNNSALNLYNPIATEITGNASNNNVLNWIILYRVVAL